MLGEWQVTGVSFRDSFLAKCFPISEQRFRSWLWKPQLCSQLLVVRSRKALSETPPQQVSQLLHLVCPNLHTPIRPGHMFLWVTCILSDVNDCLLQTKHFCHLATLHNECQTSSSKWNVSITTKNLFAGSRFNVRIVQLVQRANLWTRFNLPASPAGRYFLNMLPRP